MMSVVIENDFQDTLSEEVQAPADPDALSVQEMVEIVKNAASSAWAARPSPPM